MKERQCPDYKLCGLMTIFLYNRLTRNLEIGNTPSEFCSISRDLGMLGIQSLTRISLIKCYEMLQNSRVTAYTVSELSKES